VPGVALTGMRPTGPATLPTIPAAAGMSEARPRRPVQDLIGTWSARLVAESIFEFGPGHLDLETPNGRHPTATPADQAGLSQMPDSSAACFPAAQRRFYVCQVVNAVLSSR
jgi:hypothetical protein